jgi:hypothetical protein
MVSPPVDSGLEAAMAKYATGREIYKALHRNAAGVRSEFRYDISASVARPRYFDDCAAFEDDEDRIGVYVIYAAKRPRGVEIGAS